jgi:hypothetical protein
MSSISNSGSMLRDRQRLIVRICFLIYIRGETKRRKIPLFRLSAEQDKLMS